MEHRVRYDVLRTRAGRALLSSPLFPLGAQVLLLAALLSVAWCGWGVGQDASAQQLLTLRKVNLATLVVWGLWWPGMIVMAVVAGRAWCTVCPLELLHRIGDLVARRGGWPRARLGRFLLAGWAVTGAYVVLQLAVAGYSAHRVPHLAAVLLLVLAGSALVTGLLVGSARAYCRAFCPAGALLSVYGRATPLKLDVRDPAVCAACSPRDCVQPDHRDRLERRSCPSRLAPFARDPSDGCVLCLQCAKVCPKANVGLGLIAASAPSRRRGLLRPSEAAFVMVAFGFVSHEVLGEVPWLEQLFHRVPEALGSRWPGLAGTWLEAAWFLGLFPLAAWTLVALLASLFGSREGLGRSLRQAATAAAPIIALAHVAKALAKASAWIGYLPLALRDPVGARTAERLAAGSLAAPDRWLTLPAVGWTMLAVVVALGWRSGSAIRYSGRERDLAARVGRASMAAWFLAVFVSWGLT